MVKKTVDTILCIMDTTVKKLNHNTYIKFQVDKGNLISEWLWGE
jgi:hypothetical protein